MANALRLVPTYQPGPGRVKDRSGPLGTRLCSLCGPKDVSEFGAHRGTSDGLNPWCKPCKREKQREARQNNPEQATANRRRAGQKLRQTVLKAYGGKCTCCGENHPEFLAVDHINGGGTKHRREVGAGTTFYRWLIKNGCPAEYRLLCHNCNASLGYYGACPHQAERVTTNGE